MESKVDEASYQHPKPSKTTKCAQYPSSLRQDSNLTIPILPSELVTEILSRLPVKPLLQFTRVSKSWLALISSPEFIETHLSLSANNKDYTHHKVMMSYYSRHTSNLKVCSLRSLFYDSGIQAFDLDCPMISYGRFRYECRYDDVSFIGSINGLICLLIRGNDYFIWNPSIRKYKKLPNPRATKRAIFQRKSGFGYDEFHDDYKVVVVSFYNFADDGEVKIYSLKSNSWKNVDNGGRVLVNGRGMYVNGKLHWAISDDYYCYHNSKNIMSFDLADEKWETVEQPYYGEGTKFLKVGVLKSDLSVTEYKRSQINVWVRKEYGVKKSWRKILTIENHDYDILNPRFFLANKSEILVMHESTFRIYIMKDGSFKIPEFINFDSHFNAEIYLESLVCPFSTRMD